MCGILGVVAHSPVNQLLYDGLLLLQHRGQDAAGIVTARAQSFHMHKGRGMVRDVFRTRNMRVAAGQHGHRPLPLSRPPARRSRSPRRSRSTSIRRSASSSATTATSPTPSSSRTSCSGSDLRHVNTNSDSEVLLNVLAHELQEASAQATRSIPPTIFAAVAGVHRRVRGAYAVVAMIAGYGLLAFRDPFGIRPLVFGYNETDGGHRVHGRLRVASRSMRSASSVLRDVAPGEAIFIDEDGNFYSRQCARERQRSIPASSSSSTSRGPTR